MTEMMNAKENTDSKIDQTEKRISELTVRILKQPSSVRREQE